MVRDHPTICQIDVFLKLDRDQLRVDLNNRPDQPVSNAIAVVIVIAQDFDVIADTVDFFTVGRGCEIKSRQFSLLKTSGTFLKISGPVDMLYLFIFSFPQCIFMANAKCEPSPHRLALTLGVLSPSSYGRIINFTKTDGAFQTALPLPAWKDSSASLF